MKNKVILPNHGEIRVITKFAWFPITIKSVTSDHKIMKETRWLEIVKIKQEFDDNIYIERWINISFID